jgi:uncharacterized protein with PIN domain
VDGRIEHGFRARFRELAKIAGCPDPDGEAELRVREAMAAAASGRIAPAQALAAVWARALESARFASSAQGSRELAAPWTRFDEAHIPRFLCDPSLAGLARWLRAMGYEAGLAAGVPGYRLPDEALRRGLVLLTTEAEVLDRRIVADGSLTAVWVPSALTMSEQLHLVALELGLTLREPRCMACGGTLVPTPKDEVRSRIPPRTALWKDEYFVCAGCGQLFWRGTHWERIEATLRRAVAA